MARYRPGESVYVVHGEHSGRVREYPGVVVESPGRPDAVVVSVRHGDRNHIEAFTQGQIWRLRPNGQNRNRPAHPKGRGERKGIELRLVRLTRHSTRTRYRRR